MRNSSIFCCFYTIKEKLFFYYSFVYSRSALHKYQTKTQPACCKSAWHPLFHFMASCAVLLASCTPKWIAVHTSSLFCFYIPIVLYFRLCVKFIIPWCYAVKLASLVVQFCLVATGVLWIGWLNHLQCSVEDVSNTCGKFPRVICVNKLDYIFLFFFCWAAAFWRLLWGRTLSRLTFHGVFLLLILTGLQWWTSVCKFLVANEDAVCATLKGTILYS